MAASPLDSRAGRVTLEDMLSAREKRVQRQKEFLKTGEGVLICFTLNIPGEFKVFDLAREAFCEGLSSIEARLRQAGARLLEHGRYEEKTGYEAYYLMAAEAAAIKKSMMDIEDNHPLGRIFDIDVLSAQGGLLKAMDYGRGPRPCFLCPKPAWVCGRSRSHSLEQVLASLTATMGTFFRESRADHISSLAVKAMLNEINCSPKPGLVDRHNNGAHQDMDFLTFLNSTAVLGPWFRKFFLLGLDKACEPQILLARLRYFGRQAEAVMLKESGGANTHKGAIFSLGILCAACGVLYGRGEELNPETLRKASAEIGVYFLGDLEAAKDKAQPSGGETAYIKFGLKGVRGEAAQGFPGAFLDGYQALREALAQGTALNEAGVIALLRIMARTEDSNIVKRRGEGALKQLRQKISRALMGNQDISVLMAYAAELDAQLIAENLSPGGCADLLSLTFFIYFLFGATEAAG